MSHELPPIVRNVPPWHGECYCDSAFHANGECRNPQGTNAPRIVAPAPILGRPASVYCPTCEGTGRVAIGDDAIYPGLNGFGTDCRRCDGKGTLPK